MKIYFIGYASGIAAKHTGAGQGPGALQLEWQAVIKPELKTSKLEQVSSLCQQLAKQVAENVASKKFFMVMGGDHSAAIGTWSGVAHALDQDNLGLIWIDAHMDSHTPETTETGNIHGMPLACLLGEGDVALTNILNANPKLKPENICLIGIRSYEAAEEKLLAKKNVRIFFMEEVKQRGLEAVMQEAIKIVTKNTVGYGLSIDLDAIDPIDAPGTGTREPEGIPAADLCEALKLVSEDSRLLGAEIVEFDPTRDENNKTEKLIFKLIEAISHARQNT